MELAVHGEVHPGEEKTERNGPDPLVRTRSAPRRETKERRARTTALAISSHSASSSSSGSSSACACSSFIRSTSSGLTNKSGDFPSPRPGSADGLSPGGACCSSRRKVSCSERRGGEGEGEGDHPLVAVADLFVFAMSELWPEWKRLKRSWRKFVRVPLWLLPSFPSRVFALRGHPNPPPYDTTRAAKV